MALSTRFAAFVARLSAGNPLDSSDLRTLDEVAQYLEVASIPHIQGAVVTAASKKREKHWTDCPICGGSCSPFNDACTGFECSKCGRDHWPTEPH